MLVNYSVLKQIATKNTKKKKKKLQTAITKKKTFNYAHNKLEEKSKNYDKHRCFTRA